MKTEHLSTDRKARNKEQKIDDQLRDSFPTSDPPHSTRGQSVRPRIEKRTGSLRLTLYPK